MPEQAPPAPVPQNIPLRCIGGNDAGMSLIVRPGQQLVLGKAYGVGVGDTQVADQHAVFFHYQGSLAFQGVGGQWIVINGTAQAQGMMADGQQFQLGGSLWQAGGREFSVAPSGVVPAANQAVSGAADVIDSLKDRLHRLTGTDKLEGFSLTEMFSEVFRKRTREEVEDYFLVGTSRTTPSIQDVPTGWPKPWFFLRVLGFVALLYIGLSFTMSAFPNMNLIPGMLLMGSLAMPLATVFLFFELNTPRNVSFPSVLMLVCVGGVVSLFTSLFGFSVGGLGWLGASSAGIVEEIGKLLAVVILVREARYRYILNGLLFGASVGAGFAVFESAGYAFRYLFESRNLAVMTSVIHTRALMSPFAHVAWTAITAAALWRVKGDRPMSLRMFGDARFWRTFAVPVALHMIWNSPLPSFFYLKFAFVGAVAWFLIFALVQQGLRQVRAEQAAVVKQDLEDTQRMAARRA